MPTPLGLDMAYGTMEGDYERCGSLYSTGPEMTPDGRATELLKFSPNVPCVSFHSLMQASDGHLYLSGEDSIYRITLAGEMSLVRTLDPLTEGSNPDPFTVGRDGHLYGTASGGPLGGGTLFKLSLGLPTR